MYHLQESTIFSTDEIYATIEIGDYDAMVKRIGDIANDLNIAQNWQILFAVTIQVVVVLELDEQ